MEEELDSFSFPLDGSKVRALIPAFRASFWHPVPQTHPRWWPCPNGQGAPNGVLGIKDVSIPVGYAKSPPLGPHLHSGKHSYLYSPETCAQAPFLIVSQSFWRPRRPPERFNNTRNTNSLTKLVNPHESIHGIELQDTQQL